MIFMKSVDERVWLAVEHDPYIPMIEDTTTKQNRSKTREEWDTTDITAMSFNNKALYYITSGLCPDEYRWVSICKIAKESWDILVTTHEGTATVRNSKKQALRSRSENCKMQEDEKF